MPRLDKPHPVDVHVGTRLQIGRTLNGLSQTELAERLGVTFQQLQKYEQGKNRISAGRLWQAAKVIDVPVSYFFEGLGGESEPVDDFLTTRAGLELVRNFETCPEGVQLLVSSLCKTIAEENKPGPRKKHAK